MVEWFRDILKQSQHRTTKISNATQRTCLLRIATGRLSFYFFMLLILFLLFYFTKLFPVRLLAFRAYSKCLDCLYLDMRTSISTNLDFWCIHSLRQSELTLEHFDFRFTPAHASRAHLQLHTALAATSSDFCEQNAEQHCLPS